MASSGHPEIEVRLIDRTEHLPALAPHWDNLLERSLSRSVFLTWDWIATWWQFFGASYSLCILVATETGRVCGIAPTVVRKETGRLEFIGQNRAYGEYLDFLVERGEEHRIAPALAGQLADLHFTGRWQCMNLGVIPATSPNLPHIMQAFHQKQLLVRKMGERISPYLRFPSRWEDYLAMKGGGLRKRILYNRRRLTRRGDLRIEYARSEVEVDHFFQEFVELHNERWSHSQDGRFLAFHQCIAQRFRASGYLLLARLRIGDMTAAIKYDFVYAGKIWGYQGGWRKDMAKLEVGSVLLCEIFAGGIAEGLEAYDFLEGDDWYKRRWSTGIFVSHDLVYGKTGGAYVFG